MQQLTSLISKEVNGQKGMSARIAMYYHMTRKQNNFRPHNTKSLAERCKMVRPELRAKAREMMESGALRWIDN